MNKESRYDNITGEWNPAEWEENVNTFYCYPPSRYEDNENFINHYRNQDPAEIPATRHTVNIGKGHHMFGDIDVAGHESGDLVPYAYYNIHGISKTLEDAQKESFRYNDYFHKKFGDTPHYQTGDQFTNEVGYHHSSINDDGGTNTSFLASPIKNKSGDTIGYSWVQDHQIIGSKFSDMPFEHGLIKAKQSIEQAHKDLYDMNNPKNPKLAAYHENNEWEPEEWSQEDIEHSIWTGNPGETYNYPATDPEKIDHNDPKTKELQAFGYKTTNIGKGHLFNASIDYDPSDPEWTDVPLSIVRSYYSIHGIAKTKEEALQETGRYRQHFFHNSGYPHHFDAPDLKFEDWSKKDSNAYDHVYTTEPGRHGNIWLSISSIHDPSGKIIGHKWTQEHTFDDLHYGGGENERYGLDCAKKDIEDIHKQLHDMNAQDNGKEKKNTSNPFLSYKQAHYNITGEWEPEEWHEENGLSYYPPPSGHISDVEHKEPTPHPELSTVNIGRGHLFTATIDHSTNFVEGCCTVFGKSKSIEDAQAESSRYSDAFYHMTKTSNPPWNSETNSRLYIGHIKNNSGDVIGYNWAQDFGIYPLDADKKDHVKNIIESTHKYFHDMNNNGGKQAFASYDQITGEWEPEEWSTVEWDKKNYLSVDPNITLYSHHYPKNINAEPIQSLGIGEPGVKNISVTNIGKGNLFNAEIRTNNKNEIYHVQYKINGISKSLEEAKKEADKYADAHAKFVGKSPEEFKQYDIDNDGKRIIYERENGHIWNISDTSYVHIDPINQENYDKPLGYRWATDHFIPLKGLSLDEAKHLVEKAHKYFHDINNNGGKQAFASYDQITGEWEPEEFGTHYEDTSDRDQLHYPPLLHKTYSERLDSEGKNKDSWDKAFRNFYPHPDQGSISIGNGHQLQSTIWRDYKNDTHVEYRVHGIARTEEEANAQADKYLDYHKNKLNIGPEDIHRRDYETDDDAGYYTFSNFYDTTNSGYPDCIGKPLHAERYIKPLTGNDGKIVGYSWEQNHHIPTSNYKLLNRDDAMELAQLYILTIHKDLHDMNNPQTPKFAKVYTTDIDEEGYCITKVADRMSPEELGPEFSGTDQQEQNLDGTVDNQPREVSETIPSSNSFFTHDTLASITASYDQITGEWEPEEWNTVGDCSYYPPYRHDLVEY